MVRDGTAPDVNEWVLAYEGFDPAREGLREALCTLGNGYFATRGAAPESRADGVHYPGTYVAGCWNRLRDEVLGQSIDNESMVNLPNWLPVTFAVDDAELPTVLAAVASLRPRSIVANPPSLEELFLRHYGDELAALNEVDR